MAQNKCVTNSGYWGAVSEKILDKAVGYANQMDLVALQKLKDSGLLFTLRPGLHVYIVDRVWAGKIKIRLAGEIFTVWALSEAVDCK